MHDTAKVPGTRDDGRPVPRPVVDEELADQLLGKAQAEGVELLGPDGLLSQVTKAVLERALAEEMTGYLGYEKHDPAGRGSGNSRNGTTPETVLTEVGAVDLAVRRDRGGTFEPQIVRKGQTRLKGFNERIIALYARGMTTRDIRAHLREMYDVEVSPDLISRVTDAVIEELAEWPSRPLDRVWPVIFIDALMVKIRDGVVTNRPVYLAIGIDCDGAKQVLGLWAGSTTGESAKFWLSVLSELRSRGVADVCIVCCDGLTGLPGAIGAVWPQAVVQLCVVHRGRQESTCWISRVRMLWWCVGGGEEAGGRGGAVVCRGDDGAVVIEDGQDVVDRVPEGAFADAGQVGEGVEGADSALVEDGGENPVAVGDLLAEDSAAGAGAPAATALAVAVLFDRGSVGHDQFLKQGVQCVGSFRSGAGRSGHGGPGAAGRARRGRCRWPRLAGHLPG